MLMHKVKNMMHALFFFEMNQAGELPIVLKSRSKPRLGKTTNGRKTRQQQSSEKSNN
jgi:hypothetical protein